MSPSRFMLALILMMGLSGLAPSRSTGQATNTASKGLSNQDVADMLKSGLSPEITIAKIKTGPCSFDTSPSALKELKAAGIPDGVILAMVEASGTAKPTSAIETNTEAAASSEPAHLRVYRQRRYMGYNLVPSIYVDDKQIVRIGNGRHCTIKLSPGPHTIRSDDKSSAISLDAKPGQEFFIRVDEETGFWKGHGKLTLLLPEQGDPEYKLQKPVETEWRIAKDMLEDDTAAPK